MTCAVIRRVGGLEERPEYLGGGRQVIRRVGGLEEYVPRKTGHRWVIRRVGGLEVTVGAFLRLPLT